MKIYWFDTLLTPNILAKYNMEINQEVIETLNFAINHSYDLFKEDDGKIHRRSIIQKLCEAELYYNPAYIYEVFDAVDETGDEILTLEEFTNFYHIINSKGDCVRQHSYTNTSNDVDFQDIAIGFVIIGVTAAGALYFANKVRK